MGGNRDFDSLPGVVIRKRRIQKCNTGILSGSRAISILRGVFEIPETHKQGLLEAERDEATQIHLQVLWTKRPLQCNMQFHMNKEQTRRKYFSPLKIFQVVVLIELSDRKTIVDNKPLTWIHFFICGQQGFTLFHLRLLTVQELLFILLLLLLWRVFWGWFFPGVGAIFPNERNSKHISKGMMSNLVCCNDMPSLEIIVWILALLCQGRAWAEQSTLSCEY